MVRSIIAPTYFWPGGSSNGWSRVVMAAAYVHAVLLNPNSGPGSQQEQVFVDVAHSSQAAGMKVLGYVDSAYGARNIQDMVQEFNLYSAWYQVDGFFIDDMYIADETKVAFYKQVHDYAKNSSLYTRDSVANTQLIFNPGEPDVPEAYMPYADTFVTFEDSADRYQSFQPAAYTNNYDASKFWHIVHTCETSAAVNATLSQFAAQHAEFLYLTDLVEPNPYYDLPSTDVWAQLLAYMSNNTANTTSGASSWQSISKAKHAAAAWTLMVFVLYYMLC